MARVRDVFKIYRAGDEEAVALRGVSMELRQGEFVALLGRSGSGKSTLLHLLGGLETPSAGSIEIGNTDIGRLSEEERASIRQDLVGIVLQRDNLIPYLSAEENVALPLRLAGNSAATQRASSLLTRVGLSHRASHRVYQLSGGEQQRVSVAVALAREPAILLGDEVTGELDSETAARLIELLDDLRREEGLTLLVVTHDSAVAARAGRTLSMNDGVIVGG